MAPDERTNGWKDEHKQNYIPCLWGGGGGGGGGVKSSLSYWESHIVNHAQIYKYSPTCIKQTTGIIKICSLTQVLA